MTTKRMRSMKSAEPGAPAGRRALVAALALLTGLTGSCSSATPPTVEPHEAQGRNAAALTSDSEDTSSAAPASAQAPEKTPPAQDAPPESAPRQREADGAATRTASRPPSNDSGTAVAHPSPSPQPMADAPSTGAERRADPIALVRREWRKRYGEPCLAPPRVEVVPQDRWKRRVCSASQSLAECKSPGNYTNEYWKDPPVVLIREGAGRQPSAIAHEWLHALEMRCDPPAPRAWWVYYCHGADPRNQPDHECTKDRSGWEGPIWGEGGMLERVEAAL